jgi:hypothetical protein
MASQGGEVKAPSTQARASAYPPYYVHYPSGPPSPPRLFRFDCVVCGQTVVYPFTSYVCPCCQRRSLTSVVVNGVAMCAPCALEDPYGA